jgi:hypothetical protein
MRNCVWDRGGIMVILHKMIPIVYGTLSHFLPFIWEKFFSGAVRKMLPIEDIMPLISFQSIRDFSPTLGDLGGKFHFGDHRNTAPIIPIGNWTLSIIPHFILDQFLGLYQIIS